MTTTGDAPLADPAEVRRAIEYYEERGWTDGLPVVPVTESCLGEFLAQTTRDPGEVLAAAPHLNRACTVRLVAGANNAGVSAVAETMGRPRSGPRPWYG
jgi:hypothetical protein